MDVIVSRTDLLKLLSKAIGIAGGKTVTPVLSTILLTADGKTLKADATDLYLAVASSTEAEVKTPGAVCVPAKNFFERAKLCAAGPIRLTSKDGSSVIMKSVGTARKYTVPSMPGTEFPPMPFAAEGSPTLAIDTSVLSQLIAATIFSVSTDESRAHLNAALFEWDGSVVRMVSTDGHRLTKMEVTIEGRQASAKMLIQLKALQELRRMCDEKEEGKEATLQITQSGSSAFFKNGNTTFSVKLVDAVFPPYEQIIPKNSNKKVKMPRAAFADALRAVSIAASERTGGVKMTLSKNKMTITSESPESGDGSDEVEAEFTGADFSTGFNAKYFLDVLGALDEEHVVLELGPEELNPGVLKPVSDRAMISIIMPMRL